MFFFLTILFYLLLKMRWFLERSPSYYRCDCPNASYRRIFKSREVRRLNITCTVEGSGVAFYVDTSPSAEAGALPVHPRSEHRSHPCACFAIGCGAPHGSGQSGHSVCVGCGLTLIFGQMILVVNMMRRHHIWKTGTRWPQSAVRWVTTHGSR